MTPQLPTPPDLESVLDPTSLPRTPQRARDVVVWAAMIWVGLFYAGLLVVFGYLSFIPAESWARQETPWTRLLLEHSSAAFGIPLSCAAALFAVFFLESQYGHIEIKAWGVEFKGAAAPIIMGILGFLALIHSVKLLW